MLILTERVMGLERCSHLRHALILLDGDKLVVHAVNQQDGHGELGVVHLVPLGPVLPAHHGTQHKGRHVEGVVVFQQLLLLGALPSEAGPAGSIAEQIYLDHFIIKKTEMIFNCGWKETSTVLHEVSICIRLTPANKTREQGQSDSLIQIEISGP